MSSDNYKSDTFDAPMLFIIFVVVTMICTFIYTFPPILIAPWALFRFCESYLFGIFSDTHVSLRNYLLNESWYKIGYKTAFLVERELMFHSTWLYLTFFFKPIYNIIRKNTLRDRLRVRLDLEEIIEQETRDVWRYNRWLTKFNPSKESSSLTSGRYAIRESLYSGLKRTKALSLNRDSYELKYDEDVLKNVFVKQLKHPNQGIENLPHLYKKLFCAFALREDTLGNIYDHKVKRKAKCFRMVYNLLITPLNFVLKAYTNYDLKNVVPQALKQQTIMWERQLLKDNEDLRIEYLGDLSFEFCGELPSSLIDKITDDIFNKARKNPAIIDLFSQHAFYETALRRLLYEGRNYGKFPPNHFSWLKLVDRPMWYVLNDEMLPGASFEAMGVKSHFELEVETKFAEPFPQVDQGLALIEGVCSNLSPKEFDRIKVDMEHPYSELYSYDPNKCYQEHLERLNRDPAYKLRVFKLENNLPLD